MVERGGLENRYTFTGIGGSNPPLSANHCLVEHDCIVPRMRIRHGAAVPYMVMFVGRDCVAPRHGAAVPYIFNWRDGRVA